MKGPFETVREIFFENLERTRENTKYNFSNMERFMLWIVGFSIGGLSIIATNLTDFDKRYEHDLIKIVLVFLTISIILGIIYRWAFHLLQIENQEIEFYLRSAFSDKKMMKIETDDISNETDVREVIRRIKVDFGEDLSRLLEEYGNMDSDGNTLFLQEMKDRYNKIDKWAKNDFEKAKSHIKEIFKITYGFSNEKIERKFSPRSSKKILLLSRIVNMSLLLCCLSFIAVVIILVSFY